MSTHPARKLAALVLPLFLVFGIFGMLLSQGCSDPEMEQALADAEQDLAQCRQERQQLQEQAAKLRQAVREADSAPAPADAGQDAQAALEGSRQRIRQLEYTLNRAYIDMKTALLEREQCQKRYRQVVQERDELRRRLEQTAGGQ